MVPSTILIVDDEPDIVDIIEYYMQREGYHILKAYNGNEAYQLVLVNPQIDLVISDVKMPSGSGIDLLKNIKQKNAFRPKVIFLTGHSDVPRQQAIEMGAEDVLAKPMDLARLSRVVQDLLLKV